MKKPTLSIMFRSMVSAYNETIFHADKQYPVHYVFKNAVGVITLYLYDNNGTNTAIEVRDGGEESIKKMPIEVISDKKISYDIYLNNQKAHYSDLNKLCDEADKEYVHHHGFDI